MSLGAKFTYIGPSCNITFVPLISAAKNIIPNGSLLVTYLPINLLELESNLIAKSSERSLALPAPSKVFSVPNDMLFVVPQLQSQL